MNRALFFAALALVITSCGVQRPLLKPKDIPAFKEQQRQKREQMEQEQRELEQSIQQQQAPAPTVPAGESGQ